MGSFMILRKRGLRLPQTPMLEKAERIATDERGEVVVVLSYAPVSTPCSFQELRRFGPSVISKGEYRVYRVDREAAERRRASGRC
jgi:hypothetical protein